MNLLGDLSNITDPLDFKTTKVPKLFEVDSLLRCHICKEFLSAPMLTSCGHTFCSVCIRKYLIHTPKCPICAKELRESNLSRNVLLEQVVISYKDVRNDLLKNLEIPKERPSKEPIQSAQKLYDVDSSKNSIELIEDVDADYDDDVIIIDELKKRKSEATGIDSLFKKRKAQEEKKGVCPICNKMLPLRLIETTHIDACLANPQPAVQTSTSSSKKSPTKTMTTPMRSSTPDSPSPYFQPKEVNSDLKKLTKLDYASLSTSALKQKLTKLELPVTGTRNQLENRYNEYLILWNANCDSVIPKNPKVLRKQLSQWENSLKFKSTNSERQLDEGGWNQLIAQAKKSTMKGKTNDKVEEEEKVNSQESDDNNPLESEGNKRSSSEEQVKSPNDVDVNTSKEEQFFND